VPVPVAVDAAPARPMLSKPTTNRDASTKCAGHGKGDPDPKNPGCKSDAECKEHPHGACNRRGGGHDAPRNECEYDTCFSDADCGKGTACECSSDGTYCAQASCRSSADCNGEACSQDRGCRSSIQGWSCHSPKDECNSDEDCTAKPGSGCHFSRELGHWACSELRCPVG
jgi:hypothetical protein